MSSNNNHFTKLSAAGFLISLGIIYGDIGTSPLYAINEVFFGHSAVGIARDNILGVISIIFWALTIVVTFKYVALVLRADNEGEGGVFALYSLVNTLNAKGKVIITSLLIIGAGLLFGDGIAAAAISLLRRR